MIARVIERESERAIERAIERASDRASERAIISRMYTFINMVMTRVKNRSPDMILTAFDGKFHEKKNELPPEACRPSKKLRKNNVGPDRTGFFVPDFVPDRTRLDSDGIRWEISREQR